MVNNTSLSEALRNIEIELALLMQRHQRALREDAERRQLQSNRMEGTAARLSEEKSHRLRRSREEASSSSAELRERQKSVAGLAADAGVDFRPIFIPADGSGMSGEKLRRLAYLCAMVGEVDQEEWGNLLEKALSPRLTVTPLDAERLSAVVELAAFLQATGWDKEGAWKITGKRRGVTAALFEDIRMGAERTPPAQERAAYVCLTPMEARLDYALMHRSARMPADSDIGGSIEGVSEAEFQRELKAARRLNDPARAAYTASVERFYQIWKRDGRDWREFNDALDERRRRRMADGRGCLIPAEFEAAIRVEVARMRQLAQEARTDEGAAKEFESRVEGSESVISAAAGAASEKCVQTPEGKRVLDGVGKEASAARAEVRTWEDDEDISEDRRNDLRSGEGRSQGL